MNKNIKTCPNCDAYEVHGEYHSLFGCGSYYSDMRSGTPTITEKREGYRFQETLQCAHNRIAVLNIRLRFCYERTVVFLEIYNLLVSL